MGAWSAGFPMSAAAGERNANPAAATGRPMSAQTRSIGGEDPLEAGYSPPERPLGMREEATLDQRLAEEVAVHVAMNRQVSR